MASLIPQELNWVEKRAACTVATVFNQLCDGIKADVEAINAALHLTEKNLFQADIHSDGTTIIVGQPNVVPRKRLYIGTNGERIQVFQEWDKTKWSATIGLNDEGRCTLRLDSVQELEQWQFRKKALEGLFFGEVGL
ncbi:MAG: hypothetical protein WBE72_17085 [Terracidiphilus sp.]